MADDNKPAHEIPPELAELRHSIDNIDAAVLHLLAERFKCTQKVGRLKARLNMPPADPVREAQQIARLRSLAVNADLAPEFAEKFLGFLTKEVIRHHEIIRDGGGGGSTSGDPCPAAPASPLSPRRTPK